MVRAASTGKTGKTVVLPGFSASETWSYLDFLMKAKNLPRSEILFMLLGKIDISLELNYLDSRKVTEYSFFFESE